MARTIRVLHVVDGDGPPRRHRLLAALVAQSREQSVESHVLVAHGPGGPELPEAVEHAAKSVRSIDRMRFVHPDAWHDVMREIRATDAAVVHSHHAEANVASRVAARIGGARHLATIDGLPGRASSAAGHGHTTDGLTAVLSDVVVAPSRALAATYAHELRIPPHRMVVIPPVPEATSPGGGFDRDALREHLTGDAEAPLVLAIGDLRPTQGFDDLIDAARLLARRLPQARFVIAGSGDEAARLRDRADRARADGAITFVGACDDAGALLAAADLFCLPSRHDGVPLRLIEAMTAGVPCVATEVGGVRALLERGAAGLLVEPESPGALAHGIARLVHEPRLAARLGERAAELAAERHSAAAIARRYLGLYRELLAAEQTAAVPEQAMGKRRRAPKAA